MHWYGFGNVVLAPLVVTSRGPIGRPDHVSGVKPGAQRGDAGGVQTLNRDHRAEVCRDHLPGS